MLLSNSEYEFQVNNWDSSLFGRFLPQSINDCRWPDERRQLDSFVHELRILCKRVNDVYFPSNFRKPLCGNFRTFCSVEPFIGDFVVNQGLSFAYQFVAQCFAVIDESVEVFEEERELVNELMNDAILRVESRCNWILRISRTIHSCFSHVRVLSIQFFPSF